MMNNCWWWGPGSFVSGPWVMFVGIAFWLTIIAGVVYFVVRTVSPRAGETKVNETPLDILKRRYAKGEIDSEEFEQRKRAIES